MRISTFVSSIDVTCSTNLFYLCISHPFLCNSAQPTASFVHCACTTYLPYTRVPCSFPTCRDPIFLQYHGPYFIKGEQKHVRKKKLATPKNVKVRRTLLRSLLQMSFHDIVIVKYCDCISYSIRVLCYFHTVLGHALYGQPESGATQDQERSVRQTRQDICVGDCDRCSNGDVLEAPLT